MMFTAFLISAQFLYKPTHGHVLYMHHLQLWFRALSRDEARDGFRNNFDVPPRVCDAEKILQELTEFRNDEVYFTHFDTLVCQMDT